MFPLRSLVWIRSRATALRGQPVLACVIGALILGLVAADAALIIYLRGQAIAFGERETANLSYALSEQTEKSLRSVQLITSVIAERIERANPVTVEDFERIAGSDAVRDILHGSINGFGHIDNLAIASARGRLVGRGAAGPLPPLDLAERDYVVGARDIGPSELYISAPSKSLLSGAWSVFLAKRVSSATGAFLGVVTGVIELSTLERLYSKIALGRYGSIWMVRLDGTLLARYPRDEKVIGRTLNKESPLAAILFHSSEGVANHSSPTDGRERIAAVHRVENFPVAITVTAAYDDVLAQWRRQVASLVLAGLCASLALAFLALILANATEELARARSELDVSREHEHAQGRFLAAIRNMRQGLAMFDEHENLIVCNQQYADLYKLPMHVCAPGAPRRLLLEHRAAAKTAPRVRTVTSDGHRLNELEDGRTINISHGPMPDGGFVSTHEDVTEHHRAEEQIARLARHDPLTDLPNRMVFKEALTMRVASLARGRSLAVHYLDLDGFKLVNDTLGHTAGDELLKKVARRLAKAIRATEVLARLGGDEFAMLQSIESPEQAERLAARVNEILTRPFTLDGQRIRIGSCVGISISTDETRDPDQLIKNADLALYAAKSAGRNIYKVFHPDMAEATQERLQLERELRDALGAGQLELFYQPQVRLSDAELIGFEALLRWRHPTRGLLAPGAFIGIAEETGLINEIGEWAIVQACAEAMKWPDHTRVAVNLSVVQLRSETLRRSVQEALAMSGLHPSRLELEVTESVMLKDADANVSALLSLRSLGLKISMDDFGTGYSSLSGLRLFPFDTLKIDRSFVSELSTRDDCAAIVRSVADLANSLGMSTTAEGIETHEQWRQARALGCKEGQGYLFGAPAPADQIAAMFEGRQVA